jgi:hypothetical protein
MEYPITSKCKTVVNTSGIFKKIEDDYQRDILRINNIKLQDKPRQDSQDRIENILLQRGTCIYNNSEIVNDMKLRIFTFDDEILNEVMSDYQGINSNIHANISCAVDSIIYEGNTPGPNTPYMKDRIHNWFKNLTQIGKPSVEGYALKTSFSDKSELFVVKTPQSPDNDNLNHEAVVGFYALNKLRRFLPNFMYVYGYTKCSPAAIENKSVKSWCTSLYPNVSYLFTENIKNSVPFSDFIVDTTVKTDDIFLVFLQVLNALNLAYKKYGYTHYDLHSGNIMVRKYKKKIAIPFFGTGDKVESYIVSHYVPYIIDYGFSRIQIGNIKLGKIGLEYYGIDVNQAFPLFDTYKIICFLGEKLVQSKISRIKLELINQFFQYFGQGNITNRVIRRMTDNTDFYSLNMSYRSRTQDSYIEWILTDEEYINSILYKKVPADAYLVSNDPVPTCKFYDMISTNNPPKNNLEYCEVYASINNSGKNSIEKKELLKWLDQNFDSEKHFKKEFREFRDVHLPKIEDFVEDDNDVVIKLSSRSKLEEKSFIDEYKRRILFFSEIKMILSYLDSMIRSARCALSNQNKYEKYEENINLVEEYANKVRRYVFKQSRIIDDNIYYLKTVRLDKKSFWVQGHKKLVLGL